MPDEDEVVTTDAELENNEAATGDVAADETTADTEPVTAEDLAKVTKALEAERKLRREEASKRKAAEQALADKDKPADELAIEQARREAGLEALTKANERIVKAELRAAAADKVSNLAALVRLVDVSKIEVDDDGNPSADDLDDAITTFLADFPEFAKSQSKFSSSADQGTRKSTSPRQWTEADLARADAAGDSDGIAKAKAEGLLDNLLGVKR